MILLNQADPGPEIDEERSHPSTRHPFLADPAVREALALAVDRTTIATRLFGRTATATANILTTPTPLASTATTIQYDLDRANALLDAAGYARGDDGIRLDPDRPSNATALLLDDQRPAPEGAGDRQRWLAAHRRGDRDPRGPAGRLSRVARQPGRSGALPGRRGHAGDHLHVAVPILVHATLLRGRPVPRLGPEVQPLDRDERSEVARS